MADEITKEQIAALEAANRKKRCAESIANAVDLVARAAEGLASIPEGGTIDEVRIEIMSLLRKAINHVNEAS